MVEVKIKVSVCYGYADEQEIIELHMPTNSSVAATIEASGILDKCPEIDVEKMSVGVYSKHVDLDYVLNDGDRVEIYRALAIHPMEARRNRVV